MVEQNATEPSNSMTTVIAVLVFVAVCANAIGTFAVFEFVSSETAWLATFCIGALVAQPCILATWGGLANQTLVKRIFVSVAILFGLTCCYLGSLQMADSFGVPLDIMLILTSIPCGLYFLTASAFGLFRMKSGLSLSRHAANEPAKEKTQFSIKQLLIVTTVVAVFIPLARWGFQAEGYVGPPWLEVVALIGLYMLLTIALCVATVLAAFHEDLRKFAIVLIPILTIFGSTAAVMAMSVGFSSFISATLEPIINSVCFCTGIVCCMTIVLSIFRRVGFRLRPSANLNRPAN